MNKKEFERKLQMAGLHGKKIAVCWRIYCVLVERKETRITAPLSQANLMKLANITNGTMFLARVLDLVNACIITDTWELVE